MTKQEFLSLLEQRLSPLTAEDTADRLTFYRDMIDDRMEEGFSEEDAVAAVGPVDGIVNQIMNENPSLRTAALPKRKRGAAEIILLILGSPVWLTLLTALAASAFSILIAVLCSLIAVLVSLYAADLALAAGAAGSVLLAGYYLYLQNIAGSGCAFGTGMVCVGLGIGLFFVCRIGTRRLIRLMKWFLHVFKKRLIGRKTL